MAPAPRPEVPAARKCATYPAAFPTRPSTAGLVRSASFAQLSRSVSGSLPEIGRSRTACAALVLLSLLAATLGRLTLYGIDLFTHHRPHYSLRGFRPGWRLRPLRLCFILDDSTAERSVALAFTQLLRALSEENTEVVVLELPEVDTSRRSPPGGLRGEHERQRLLAAIGAAWKTGLPPTRHTYDASPALATSLRVHEFLSKQRPGFDQVVFHCSAGAAYYALLARGQAIAHHSTRFSLLFPAVDRRRRRRRAEGGARLAELEEAHMVRSVLRSADALFAPARQMAQLRAEGYALPPHSIAWGIGAEDEAPSGLPSAEWAEAAQLRPEDPGLRLSDGQAHGSGGEEEGSSYGGAEAVAGYDDKAQGSGQLPRRRRLLSTPERQAESAGCEAESCWGGSGILSWLRAPAATPATPATPAAARRTRNGTSLHAVAVGVEARPPERGTPPLPSRAANATAAGGGEGQGVRRGAGPLVSVCVVHHERGPLLLQALESIRAQVLPSHQLQTVLVDDGSTSAISLRILDSLSTWDEFRSSRWILLRRAARFLGAARNDAAREARGEFLFFLDDDNCLKRHALATLVGAARASGSHVLASMNEKWPYIRQPPESDETTERWLPLGAALTVGVFKNCYGDANALVRRDVFEALGGFTEDRGVGHEDWELWARAVLRGYQLQVVPEALYWYRLAGGGMLSESIGGTLSARAQRYANHARNLRPYLESLSGWPEGQDILRLAQGMFLLDGTVPDHND